MAGASDNPKALFGSIGRWPGAAVCGDDAYVLAQAANALPDLGHFTDRACLIDRALRLNPGSAYAWLVSGWINVRRGASATAMEQLERAERLEPFSTVGDGARAWMAIARFQQGRFDEALELFSRANIRNPDCIGVLAALYGRVGQIEDAKRTLMTYRQITSAPVLERVGQIFVDENSACFSRRIRAAKERNSLPTNGNFGWKATLAKRLELSPPRQQLLAQQQLRQVIRGAADCKLEAAQIPASADSIRAGAAGHLRGQGRRWISRDRPRAALVECPTVRRS
jgi:tetratricopeptide (TPR) repeat protein